MSEDRIVVNVDADLEDLIPGFLDNRRKDLASLREALSRGDGKSLQSTGHSLKGVGGGYGFGGLSEMGAEIESAAKAGAIERIAPVIDRLADYLDRIEVVFR
ncbi:MAG: Hpt domain-containing protein [Gammaproteobacteria bacterium]|nr:Hpt domain-containing protein [Gammaproteobacteria bacterium]